MNNYSFKIQYDGTNYAGWQVQQNAMSVQQRIIEAIEIITKEKVNLIGSGRTDAGVHALGQVANFKTEKEINTGKFLYSLNSILPIDIAASDLKKTDENFHARFDAKSRSYVYVFSRNKSPFYNKYSYNLHSLVKIDFDYLNKISQCILGEHDFTSFSKKNTEIEDKKCTVYEIHWKKGRDISLFYITANRFLHGMVRTIVGTLLNAAFKNLDEAYLLDVLEYKNREEAEESVPAKGLFLFKVRY